jgi:AAA family ATP:ADP antiporter
VGRIEIGLEYSLVTCIGRLDDFWCGCWHLALQRTSRHSQNLFQHHRGSHTILFADLWINALTLLIQLFLTRALLNRYGVAPLLLIPALAILIGFAALTASPVPMLVAVVQIATRAGEFSLSKPARETLYTRVDRESRYKGKAVIDTVVYRGADLIFAWVHKFMMVFGSNAVFAVGFVVAGSMSLSAWRVIKTEQKIREA